MGASQMIIAFNTSFRCLSLSPLLVYRYNAYAIPTFWFNQSSMQQLAGRQNLLRVSIYFQVSSGAENRDLILGGIKCHSERNIC